MPEAGERVTARELVVLVAGACLLAVVMHWPLVLHLGADIPKDLGDPLPQSWQVAWDGHALAHQPLDLFQSNQFWPLRDTLAFSDALIGYAPAGLLGSGPEAAVFRYDLVFLLADEGDWPRGWYERLGFRPTGLLRETVKGPSVLP